MAKIFVIPSHFLLPEGIGASLYDKGLRENTLFDTTTIAHHIPKKDTRILLQTHPLPTNAKIQKRTPEGKVSAIRGEQRSINPPPPRKDIALNIKEIAPLHQCSAYCPPPPRRASPLWRASVGRLPSFLLFHIEQRQG